MFIIKRSIALILCLVVLLSLPACCDQNVNTSAMISAGDITKNKKQLHKYDSPYTICYQNTDKTYSFYIYASPIQYLSETKYTLIDNGIKKSDYGLYAFENKKNKVRTYFPSLLKDGFQITDGTETLWFKPEYPYEQVNSIGVGKKCVYTNQWGDKVEAILYPGTTADFYFYPVKSGIRAELVQHAEAMPSITFSVHTGADTFTNQHNGYAVFSRKKNDGILDKTAIIYGPLSRSKKSGTAVEGTLVSEEKSAIQYLTFQPSDKTSLDKNGKTCIELSFELYQNKIPDTTVYQDRTTNAYLSNYAVIGDHPKFGEGWHYTRFRLNYFLMLKPEQILEATYHIRMLNSGDSSNGLKIWRPTGQWSSTTMTWDDKIDCKDLLAPLTSQKGGWYNFDITEFSKSCYTDRDWLQESEGGILTAEKSVAFATDDNALYPPYIELLLDTLPVWFDCKDNPNQDIL